MDQKVEFYEVSTRLVQEFRRLRWSEAIPHPEENLLVRNERKRKEMILPLPLNLFALLKLSQNVSTKIIDTSTCWSSRCWLIVINSAFAISPIMETENQTCHTCLELLQEFQRKTTDSCHHGMAYLYWGWWRKVILKYQFGEITWLFLYVVSSPFHYLSDFLVS